MSAVSTVIGGSVSRYDSRMKILMPLTKEG